MSDLSSPPDVWGNIKKTRMLNLYGQYEQESLEACLGELKRERRVSDIVIGGYILDGGNRELGQLYSKTRFRGYTHTLSASNMEIIEQPDVNYFQIMQEAYSYFVQPVVLVYGMVYTFDVFKQLQIRNYSVMFDGKHFKFHPLYEEDEEAKARLVLPE